MNEEFVEKVHKQDIRLTRVETLLVSLEKSLISMTTSMKSMADSYSELSTLKVHLDTSIVRVHTRIDTEVDVRDTLIKAQSKEILILNDKLDDALKDLNPFRIMGKYFLYTGLIFGLLYSFAISDIRNKIIYDNDKIVIERGE